MRWTIALFLACIGATLALAADGPATHPAGPSLFNGRIEYTPPAGWKRVKSNLPPEEVATYLADDNDGFFALRILPVNAVIEPSAAGKIMAQMRIDHKNANQEVVKPPELEKDERFTIKIHERYKTRDGKTADETHLYRRVNDQPIRLDVQSLSEDAAHIAAVRKTAEETILSAHWSASAEPLVTLLNGRIEFLPPPKPWVHGKLTNASDDSATNFGIDQHERLMMVRVLPMDASISPDIGLKMVLSLRTQHKKMGLEIVEAPTLEKDPRFPIRIHERFREKGGEVVDETHLYLQVAGRAMELNIHSKSDDSAEITADQKMAEEVLLSAHWVRTHPAKKPGNGG